MNTSPLLPTPTEEVYRSLRGVPTEKSHFNIGQQIRTRKQTEQKQNKTGLICEKAL